MKTRNNNQKVARFFWDKAWREKKFVIGVLTALPLNVLMNQIVPPIILADVLNKLARHDFVRGSLWHSFGWELVLYAVLVTLGSFSWRIIDAFAWRLEGRVESNIAGQVFSHLLSQSSKFHADNFTGSLVSQSNKLMGGYIRTADTTIFMVLPTIFGILFSVIVLAKIAPLFGSILLLFAVAYVISSIFVTRGTRRLGAQHAQIESAQTGFLADAITNAMAVKSFAGQQYEEQRFGEARHNTQQSLTRFGRATQKQMLFFGGMMSLIDALALLAAVIAVMSFNANVAAVFLIFNYAASISQQLFSFSNNALRNYNRALGDARDMVEILHAIPEVLDPVAPQTVKITRGSIVFDNVTFSHADAKSAIFTGLDLRIKPGEKVGLVGHSGSGKTTLTRLLLRFSDIQDGTITIDGQDISKITQDDLRRHIAYVPQEPLLFHRSISDNIRYGNEDASQQTIEAVARMASAHDFIRTLPHEYNTLVGERGVKLSGGQRQRIVIARALLKNAPILALDEATSALDSESEALIQDALWKLMEGRTAIVIAHRLSTIQKMDRIIVLSDGKIVEQGSHKELVSNQDGTYAKLWARQSGGFIED